MAKKKKDSGIPAHLAPGAAIQNVDVCEGGVAKVMEMTDATPP